MAKDKKPSEDDTLATTETQVVDPFEIVDIPMTDGKIQTDIHNTIRKIIMLDNRLTHDPEIIDALKDWIRAEVMLDRLYKKFEDIDKVNSATGRLFRDCLNQKNICRDAVWGKTLDKRGRARIVDEAKIVLQKDGIIDAKVTVDVID